MLRIRTKDDATLEFSHGAERIGDMNRRGSVAVGFTMSGGAPSFTMVDLEMKMIPRACMEELESIPFKMLDVDGGGHLVVQDPGSSMMVLRHDDGWLEPCPLDDITEDDDVAIYDPVNRDWALAGVRRVRVLMKDPELGEAEDALARSMSAELSRYMIRADHGIILGGILVI